MKLTMQFNLILLNIWWAMHSYNVFTINDSTVNLITNPFEVFGLPMPRDPFEGFNHGRVKKEYRALAKKYHPDK